MSKYVKVEDVMAFINTSNRGNCDYFIVDQIEELCKSNKVYDVEKVVAELEVLHDLVNVNQKLAISQAISIVRKGGAE